MKPVRSKNSETSAGSATPNRTASGLNSVAKQISDKYRKKVVVDVKSGDSVRVSQKIREGGKERLQNFEGLVIRTNRKNSLTASFTVRRIASGVGVEKTFLIHSPNIKKIVVTKRGKVRRNYLTYMRSLTGKNTRLSGVDFDKESVNAVKDEEAEAEGARLREEAEKRHQEQAAKKAEEAAKLEAKVAEALAKHEQAGETDPGEIEEKPAKEKADAKGPAEQVKKAK